MDQNYYDSVSKMEQMSVDQDYLLGWVGGYLHNPMREEQRVNEAYEAGYADGENKNTDNFEQWVK
jgi:hypothetical protein